MFEPISLVLKCQACKKPIHLHSMLVEISIATFSSKHVAQMSFQMEMSHNNNDTLHDQ